MVFSGCLHVHFVPSKGHPCLRECISRRMSSAVPLPRRCTPLNCSSRYAHDDTNYGPLLHRCLLSGLGAVALAAASAFRPEIAWSGVLESEASLESVRPPRPGLPTNFPALPDIQVPSIEEVRLGNGLRVFLLEDHEVPLVKGTLVMRGGQRASPPDKLGVATISSAVQRAGGSLAHPGEIMDLELEQRAASIEGGAGLEASTMGFECLREDTDDVMGLFSEIILSPALPQSKLDVSKAQILNVLEHRNDNAASIPRRELSVLMYGKDSVFARHPTPDQVKGLERLDLADYLAQWQRPDAAILGIVGDFDSKDMKGLVEKHFNAWQPGPSQPATPPPIPNTPLPDQEGLAGTVFLYDRPELTQATVAMGEVGVPLTDPDAFALDVLNDVLNSFGGRLFDQIRSREGLVYSVSGGWDISNLDHPGLFVARGETASPSAFLPLMQNVLQEAREVAPTQQEVEEAKEESLNSFVFNFASLTSQLQRRIAYALLGIPEDYLFQFKAGIEQVTAQDVLDAAQRNLHPASQVVVIAADAESLRPQLEAQGRRVVPLVLDD